MTVDAMPREASPSTKARSAMLWPVLVGILALIGLAMQGYYWASYGRRWTNSDQTVLWLMARDLSHGHLHQFNFYGQTYATGWETVPAAALMRFGESPASAVPLATTLLATLVFLLLAVAAVRDRRWLLAAGALAIVPFASPKYLILLDAPRGVLGGLFLGTLAVSIWFLWRDSPRASACLFALGPLAVLFDLGTVLIVGPVFVVAAVLAWRRRWWTTYAWVAIPLGYVLATHIYYDRHPGQNRFHPLPFSPRPHFLTTALRYLPDYFRLFNLGPVPGGWVVLFAFGALAYIIVRRRSWEGALALGTLVLLLAAMLSSPKSQDAVGGVYLSPSRLFLALPMAWCVIALLTAPAAGSPGRAARSAWVPVSAAAGVVLLAGVAFGHLVSAMPDVTRKVTASNTTNFILQVARSGQLASGCSRDVERARQLHAGLIAYNNASEHAYGCEALHPRTATLDLPYDRRSWRIDDLKKSQQRVLLIGAPDACSKTGAFGATTCAPVGSGAILLTGSGVTVSSMLGSVDLAILPLDSNKLPPSCMRLHDC